MTRRYPRVEGLTEDEVEAAFECLKVQPMTPWATGRYTVESGAEVRVTFDGEGYLDSVNGKPLARMYCGRATLQ